MSSVKIGGFQPKSLYAKSLIPLLDALKWNGSNIDLIEALVDNANTMDKNGLIDTLANLKYKSFVFNIKKLENSGELFPALCVEKNNIYVVIGKKNNNFLVYDTLLGEYTTISKIGKSKKIIQFTQLETEDFSLLKPQKNWFFHLLSRFQKEFSYILLISLLLTITSFITPLFIMLIHSQVKSSQSWENIAFLGVAALVFILGTTGFKYIRNYILTYISTRIGNLVNKEIYRRLLYLPPKYSESSSVRAQLNRVRDFESITDFFSSSAITSLIDIPLSILMLIGLIFIGGNIVFVPLTAYILLVVIGLFSYYAFQRINDKDVESINLKNKLQNEMLSKMSEIRLTGNKKRWFKEYDKYYSRATYSSYKTSNFLLTISSLSTSIVNIALIIGISISVTKVMAGEMSSGALFSSFIIISRILSPLRGGFSTISQFSRLKKSINQLNRFMGLKIEDRPISIRPIQSQLEGEIKFNNLFLKYGNEVRPALLNINFVQNLNTTTVITGHGGSGKSSLIKMLLALYEPISGSINIDNMNIMQLDKIQLRKSVCYLPETPYLFPGSIKLNLYLAKPDATDSQLNEALKKVGIKNALFSLPNGLDTLTSELPPYIRKDSFVKKINLAMMLLRNLSLYIIDSIEYGVDSNDYDSFKSIINSLKQKSTVIITTSREEFLDLGDNIIHMDSGRIIKIVKNSMEKKL